MRWKVLVTAPYIQPVIDRFRDILVENHIDIIVPPVNERLAETELLTWVEDIDGVICGDDQFTKKVLSAAKRLKVISKWGTGIDSIDKEEAEKLGIVVYNTPNAFTDPVADTVLGYILSFSRQIPWTDSEMRAGKWEKRTCTTLRNKTLGVVGVGNIGKAVIRRAIGFGMRILGNDIREISRNFLKDTGTTLLELDELLGESDFVSINCDLNPSSHHLIDKRELNLMKPTAYLINTARGPIVDEEALIGALDNRLIAGAALDVFEAEPLPKNSPLRQLENCLLSPHNANSSPEIWERMHKNTIQNLIDGLQSKR
jgi:D-3-phosphoglycerate dehydrogenase / 2-oxoglutarate reductase